MGIDTVRIRMEKQKQYPLCVLSSLLNYSSPDNGVFLRIHLQHSCSSQVVACYIILATPLTIEFTHAAHLLVQEAAYACDFPDKSAGSPVGRTVFMTSLSCLED